MKITIRFFASLTLLPRSGWKIALPPTLRLAAMKDEISLREPDGELKAQHLNVTHALAKHVSNIMDSNAKVAESQWAKFTARSLRDSFTFII